MPEHVRIGDDGSSCVQCRYLVDFLPRQREVENVDVLVQMGFRDGPGLRHQAQVEVPAQDNLRGRLGVSCPNRCQHRFAEQPALAERRPGLCYDAMGGVPGARCLADHSRIELDLV